jgi:hypothetical protein
MRTMGFPKGLDIVLSPPLTPEPPNKRCCACGQAYGPSSNHRCAETGLRPKDQAALRLLDAAELILLRHDLHGDTRYLDAAIRAFKTTHGLDASPRDEGILLDRVAEETRRDP